MKTMNKADIAVMVQEELGSTKTQAEAIVNTIFDTVVDKVAAGTTVSIAGFGTIEKVTRKARQGRNPQTGETINIKAKGAVKFKAAKAFKDAVA